MINSVSPRSPLSQAVPPASGLGLCPPLNESSNPPFPGQRRDGHHRRILLIDNEPDICFLVQDALGEFQGWQVTTCQNPQASEQWSAFVWDAILLEISLSRRTGLALLPLLQGNPYTRAVPIVLLTSQVRPADYSRFSQMAVAGVIAKPFDPVTLGHQIADLLGWPPGSPGPAPLPPESPAGGGGYGETFS